MPGVTRGRERLQADDVTRRDPDIRLGHRRELSPQLVERFSVQTAGARFEARRVDQVRRADLGDVNGKRWVTPYENPRCACMVEMNVRQQEMPDLREPETALRQPTFELLDARGGAAVVQRGPVVRLDDVGADCLRAAEMEEVDGLRRHVR